MPMNYFFLIPNHHKDPDLTVTREVASYLKMRGAEAVIREDRGQGALRHTEPDEVPETTDCVIVLGGDGTLIRAAGDLVNLQIPFLGINLGTLGYLTEIDRASIYPALDALLEERYLVEKRMMLHGDVWHEGERIQSGVVLNDILVSREGNPRVIKLINYVNDKYLNEYRADGIIVATPTGSTGYSLSAGGPIVSPDADLFLMTPLAAHALNTRSVILPADDNRIRIRIGAGRDGSTEHALVVFDGSSGTSLVTDDYVEIRRAERHIEIIKLHDDSFLETLRRKMQ